MHWGRGGLCVPCLSGIMGPAWAHTMEHDRDGTNNGQAERRVPIRTGVEDQGEGGGGGLLLRGGRGPPFQPPQGPNPARGAEVLEMLKKIFGLN